MHGVDDELLGSRIQNRIFSQTESITNIFLNDLMGQSTGEGFEEFLGGNGVLREIRIQQLDYNFANDGVRNVPRLLLNLTGSTITSGRSRWR